MADKPEKQAEMIFYQALEKELAHRETYLKEACADDHELYQRVDVLLQAYDSDDSLHHVPLANSQVPIDSPRNLEGPGTIIGRYKLLEKIGEGGFGVVWAAAQRTPVKRRVALKIIKLGMDTKQVVARFEAERQALALMDHPNIAKVLDGGATETGRPYFVMELVRGIPIIEYCDQENCSIQNRLDLFIKVCHAIQHAHQKGIIHRDIKPSNILITLHDGVPVPRVIDFGIAKATQQELTEMTIYTQHHQFIGTPAYMSPEQAEMSGLDIDTRSDIYSLGVLLYELLTGRTPFDAKELMQSGIDQMRKMIREQEPPKPSTKFATLQMAEQSTTATRHATDSPRLISLLRGDLDWIVMKCLEKDRARRYDTANVLALDVVRHLSNEPVIARPPTTIYQLQKAWRRNKVVFTATVTVSVTLLLATGISWWQARVATAAREQAVQEEHKARESKHKALQRAYNSDMSLAFRALEENLYGQVQDIVRQHIPEPGEPDFRGWEWCYAWAQSRSDAVHKWDIPEGMGEAVTVRISPNQQYMVSSDFYYGPTYYHHARRLWDFATREELKNIHLPGGSARGFAFSNSGKLLALHRGATDLHGGGKNTNKINIYNTATWESETEIPLDDKWSPSLSFSPDDKTLATIVGNKAVLWDWRGKETLNTWPAEGSWGWLNVVAFFPNGRCIAVGGNHGLKIIDLTTRDIKHHELDPNSVITALAISPDSRYVAIGFGHENGEIGVLNVASGELEAPLIGHSRTVTSLTFSANGEWLISSSADSTMRVWDMDSRISTRVLKGHQLGVGSVSLTSNETRAISASNDKQILEWDLTALPAFREHLLPEQVEQVVFSADSRSFYTLNNEGSVSIWDAKTLDKQQSFSPELGKESSMILPPNGNHLIVGTGSGQLWELGAGGLQVVVPQGTESGRILPVGFWTDGKSLVTLDPGNTVSLWNTETWKLRSSEQTERKIKFLDPNLNAAIYAIPQKSDVLLYPSGADLVWWDLGLSKELAHPRVNSHFPGSIAVSPTEPLLASSDRGDFIELWNWQTRQFKERWRGPKAFHSVAFSPDGRRLVTGSRGKGALMLWDISTRPRQEIARFGTSSADLTTVQFSPDGNVICAVAVNGNAYFLRAPSLETILEAEQKGGSTDGGQIKKAAGECRTTMQKTHRPGPTQASGLHARVEAHFMVLQTVKQNNTGEI